MWKVIGAIASAVVSGVGVIIASRNWGRDDQRKKDAQMLNEANETAAAATDILNMAQESEEAPVEE